MVTCEIKISYSIYVKEVSGTLMRIPLNNIVMCIVLISVIHEHGVFFLFFFFGVFHNFFYQCFVIFIAKTFQFLIKYISKYFCSSCK